MKTLVIANQKGGVGKTSTLFHLAFDFLERGLKVAVIDLDPQGNASYSLSDYSIDKVSSSLFKETNTLTPINKPSEASISLISADSKLTDMDTLNVGEVAGYFKQSIADLESKDFDVCLIDTAPSLGICMAGALISSDFVLSPIEVEVYSIQGIKKMLTTISNIRKINPSLSFLGMVPSKLDGRNPRHKKHLQQLNEAYPSLMIPVSIGLRSSIADAVATGVPVWKIKKTAARKAATEVRALTKYVFEKIMELNND